MADEARLHDLLDLVDHARSEGDKDTEAKAIAAYRRESNPAPARNPNIPQGDVPSLPGEPVKPGSKPFSRAPQEGIADDVKRVAKSVLGPAAQGLAGAAENTYSGLTGLVGSAANIAGKLTGAQHFAREPGQSEADFYKKNREATTYQPQSEGGKEMARVSQDTIGKVFEKGGQKVSDLTGDPAAGELAKDAVSLILPKVLSEAGGALTRERPAAAQPPKAPIPEQPVESLRAAGYKIRPSDAAKAAPETGRKIATATEGFAGSDSLRKTMLMSNQKKTTSYGAQHVGLPEDTPRLTDKHFDAQSEAPMAKYRDVGRALPQFNVTETMGKELDAVTEGKGLTPKARRDIGKDVNQYRSAQMTGPDTVKTISVLRRRAAKEQASDDVNTNDIGDAHRAVADSLENELERQLGAVGDDQLINEYRDARANLAKINDIRTATKGGQVDAKVIHRLANKGVPLSGYAKIIADAYEMAPHVLEHPNSFRTVGDSVSPAISALADIGTAGTRPALRAIINSDFYQNRLGKASKPGPGAALADYFGESEPSGPTGPAEPPPNGPTARPPRLGGPPPSPFKPSQARTMLEAQKRSGNLTLADELTNPEQLPEAPSRLHAETPPPVHGDIPFKGSEPQLTSLADDLGLAQEHKGEGIPYRPQSLADQMAGDLELEHQKLLPAPNTKTSAPVPRGIEDKNFIRLNEEHLRDMGESADVSMAGQKHPGLARSTKGEPPQDGGGKPLAPKKPPEGGSGPQSTPESEMGDIVSQLGLDVKPGKRPGTFEVHVPGEKAATAYTSESAARKAASNLADDLLGEGESQSAPKPRSKTSVEDAGKGQAPAGAFDDLFNDIHVGEPDELGQFSVNSPNGETIAQPRGDRLQVIYTKTKPEAQGKGEGVARIRSLVNRASAQGLTFSSDVNVAPAAAKIYAKLEKEGYVVKKNPTTLDSKGNLISDDHNVPVFEVQPAPRKKASSE